MIVGIVVQNEACSVERNVKARYDGDAETFADSPKARTNVVCFTPRRARSART